MAANLSRMKNRKAYLTFGKKQVDTFVVFHGDLVKCLGVHSGHLFGDDLSVLIKPPIMERLDPMIQLLKKEGSRMCDQIHAYSIEWMQPIDISKAVATSHCNHESKGAGIYMVRETVPDTYCR